MKEYDIVIVGAGIAGLWLGNTLKRAGYNVLVVENKAIGAGQTLASQGMIHGGQKYALDGQMQNRAFSIATMPERWEACFGGWGEIDLTGVKFLSENQIMWPAGSILSDVAVFGAAKVVNAKTSKLEPDGFPQVLQDQPKFKGPVYELPEKVLDARSLLQALAKNLKGRIVKGDVTEVLPDGQVAISGQPYRAQLVIFTAGTGNEDALRMLGVREKHTQRRPLRQVMVRPMENELYGHGIVGKTKPRVTVTSHDDGAGGIVWYLGGNIAEEGAGMSEEETIAFAAKEMAEIFPHIDWKSKEWATWAGDRAEPFAAGAQLPPEPFLHQRGNVLVAWPIKLTFAPGLSDKVFEWLEDKDIKPSAETPPPQDLPTADFASYPWEVASWRPAPANDAPDAESPPSKDKGSWWKKTP